VKTYILDNSHRAIQCKSSLEWSSWMKKSNRVVAKTEVGDFLVSTVFLGIDHNHLGKGDPLLFESMVFDSHGRGSEMQRYFIWDEAEIGHTEMVHKLKILSSKAELNTKEIITKLCSVTGI
jgi:hypothetical protein